MRLTVIGDLVEDIVVWARGPVQVGTDNAAVIHRVRGGSAANVATRSAAEVATRFIGQVGEDPAGAALVAELAAMGVEMCVAASGRTGTVVVLVDEHGERTMFPDRAASAQLSEVPVEWLAGTTVLHVPAYGLVAEPMASAILSAVDLVRSSGGQISVDLSAASLIEQMGAERFSALLHRIAPEIVFANADEAAAAALWSREPWGVVIVKDGPRPAKVKVRSAEPGQVSPWVEVPAVQVPRVIDTTGAGDAFAAGFLASWMHGAEPLAACAAGHRRASEVLSTPGAAGPGPSLIVNDR